MALPAHVKVEDTGGRPAERRRALTSDARTQYTQ
jgi:hypothetical protein